MRGWVVQCQERRRSFIATHVQGSNVERGNKGVCIAFNDLSGRPGGEKTRKTEVNSDESQVSVEVGEECRQLFREEQDILEFLSVEEHVCAEGVVGLLNSLSQICLDEGQAVHALPESVLRIDPPGRKASVVFDVAFTADTLSFERVLKNSAVEPLAVSEVGEGASVHWDGRPRAHVQWLVERLQLLLNCLVVLGEGPFVTIEIGRHIGT